MPSSANENFDERLREICSKTLKFWAQMRAAEHRYKSLVAKGGRDKRFGRDGEAVEQRLSARVKEVERGRKVMLIERSQLSSR